MESRSGGTLDFISFNFKIVHDGCTTAITNDLRDLVIRMLYCQPFKDRGYSWVVIEAKSKDRSLLTKYIHEMREHGRVKNILETRHDIKNSSVRLSLIERYDGMISSFLYEMGALKKMETVVNGEESWNVVIPSINKDACLELIETFGKVINLNMGYPKFIDPVELLSRLTKRELDVIRVAYELGYYEFPKDVHLKDIARKTNLSIPTVNEYIRHSQRKILSLFIENFTT
jgi:predicted DNA binding protein